MERTAKQKIPNAATLVQETRNKLAVVYGETTFIKYHVMLIAYNKCKVGVKLLRRFRMKNCSFLDTDAKQFLPYNGTYMGCYIDSQVRDIGGSFLVLESTNTIENCIQECWNNFMEYAGLQYGLEIYIVAFRFIL